MNYLIGLSLTQKDYPALMGGLLYSRYGNTEEQLNNPEIFAGIHFYEALETFFLNSESFRKSTDRLSFMNKKHACTILSIFYDHFMARNWAGYNQEASLQSDMADFSKMIVKQKQFIPPRAKKKFGRIRKYKLFENLAMLNGIQEFVYQLNRNDAYEVIMQNSLMDLMTHYEDFKKDFEEFMSLCRSGKEGIPVLLHPEKLEII